MSYTRVNLTNDDTLESVASRFLGDPSRWQDIAQLNSLRYPYISSDPADHYGAVLGTTRTEVAANIGDTTLTLLPLVSDFTVLPTTVPGTILYLRVFGSQAYDAHTVVAFTPASHLCVLDGPLANAYPVNTFATIYSAPLDTTTAVLYPGDQLVIPANSNASVTASATPGNYAPILGVDFALTNGDLAADPSTGGILLVSGLPNLHGAIGRRVATTPGEIAYHPGYGCFVQADLGKANTPEFGIIAQGHIIDALMHDPRITSVDGSAIQITNDALLMNATVTFADNTTQASLDNLIVRLT